MPHQRYLLMLESLIYLLIPIIFIAFLILNRQQSQRQYKLMKQFAAHQQRQFEKLQEFTRNELNRQQQTLIMRQDYGDSVLRKEINEQLVHQNTHLHREISQLTALTEKRLINITESIQQYLSQNTTHQNSTLKDIISRLSKIDEAQKRLDSLANDVTGLKEILIDKRSRGAFGESQLKTLIDNILPAQYVQYQSTLSNGLRPDCLLKLPEPTGQLAIDSKFPLESYRKLYVNGTRNSAAAQQFAKDIRHHINDIAEKYILPPETAAGAIMFIPAEAIFAELHANFGEIIEYAHHRNVWLTSPTTLVAILTTAKTVIKDDATRKQAHLLREQLYHLKKEFQQFQGRMDNLAKHIEQAQKDVGDVHRSAKAITNQFYQLDEQ
ncbi:DNA recombination protein RmuC [Suttonella ornithocola]|uniref:DNA recombination protein rmuC n=1 Tax=Suttonella ornithocola TaxID=279832 RepID=A0A380MYN7_9GAMM|nr:DNA recombination protein RmuC [Suttonella ornithocola]SUO97422.1 DNA recombination protein rmuC [Suttonella ornithocola]